MLDEAIQIMGQLLGIVAVVLGFITYQMKTPIGILIFQIITALVFSLHYLLIGAKSAVALNLLCAIAGVFYYIREKRGGKGIVIPAIFIFLIVVMGIITWEGWYSLLITVGLVTSSVGLVLSNAQKTRMSILIKSPLCLLYNVIVSSVGGAIYEFVILVSAIIGLLKNRTSGIKKGNNNG